jgi:sialic acid synthase SpsE
MVKEFFIGKTKVGGNNPCFVVAEIGINFDSEYDIALKLIDVAAAAGCNAVKFQLFKAETMYTPKAGKYTTASGKKKDIVDIVRKGELPSIWIPKLKAYTQKKGLEFFVTTCDEHSTDILEKYHASAYKIASYEITHLPLLTYTAKTKKPIIFSSGGAHVSEIIEAVETIKKTNNQKIALMHCIGQYPAPLTTLNLRVISMLRLAFPDVVVGYSDHSEDPVAAPRAAVALGAKIIEKHITLDKNLPGPDHMFALNPAGLALMVKTIRQTEKELNQGKKIKINPVLLGTSERKTFKGEQSVRQFAYRCLFAKEPIKKGERFTKKNLIVLRPGKAKRGVEPKYYEFLTNNKCCATRQISRWQPVQLADFLLT